MGSKVNIFKVVLNVSDIDRNYYQEHKFTLALQSTEPETLVIVNILAFALNANERLLYTKGNDKKQEPDIWQKDLTGDIELWIDIGQPDEKRLRKACARSKEVIIFNYGEENPDVWWKHKSPKYNRFKNLSVMNLSVQVLEDLAFIINRTMDLQCTIQDRHVWIGNDERTVEFDPIVMKEKGE